MNEGGEIRCVSHFNEFSFPQKKSYVRIFVARERWEQISSLFLQRNITYIKRMKGENIKALFTASGCFYSE